MKITLDAGHNDYTYNFDGYREGVLARKTALKARELLEQQGHKVKLTRDEPDENPPLAWRGQQAVSFKSDLFISIHTNASGSGADQRHSSGVYGIFYATDKFDTYEPDNMVKAPNGRRLAQLCSQEISKTMGLPIYDKSNKGAKVWWRCPGNLGVLTGGSNWAITEAACLIEAGYGDNPDDRAILEQPDAHERYALGICRGIYRYKGMEIPDEWLLEEEKPEEKPEEQEIRNMLKRILDIINKLFEKWS